MSIPQISELRDEELPRPSTAPLKSTTGYRANQTVPRSPLSSIRPQTITPTGFRENGHLPVRPPLKKANSTDTYPVELRKDSLLEYSPEGTPLVRVRLPSGSARALQRGQFDASARAAISRSQSTRSSIPEYDSVHSDASPASSSYHLAPPSIDKMNLRKSDPGMGYKKNSSSNPRLQQILVNRGLDNIETNDRKVVSKTSGITNVSHIKLLETAFKDGRSRRPTIDSATLPPSDLQYPYSGPHSRNISIEPIIAKDEPTYDESMWYQNPYKAGPIKVERAFGLYAIPVMTAMDVLCQSELINDEQVIDEIVDFFEGFGFEPISTGLDQFWVVEQSASATEMFRDAMASPTRIAKASPHSLPSNTSDTSSIPSNSRSTPMSGKRWSGSHSALTAEGGAIIAGDRPATDMDAALPSSDRLSPLSIPSSLPANRSSSMSPTWMASHRDTQQNGHSFLKGAKRSLPAPKLDAFSTSPASQSRNRFSIRKILAGRGATTS